MFAISRVHKDDASNADRSTAIHPILRGYKNEEKVSQHHVIEDLMAVWQEPVHRDPLVEHLRSELAPYSSDLHSALSQPKGPTSAPAQTR